MESPACFLCSAIVDEWQACGDSAVTTDDPLPERCTSQYRKAAYYRIRSRCVRISVAVNDPRHIRYDYVYGQVHTSDVNPCPCPCMSSPILSSPTIFFDIEYLRVPF